MSEATQNGVTEGAPLRAWHVLLPDARNAKVLLRASRSGWSLPAIDLRGRGPWWRSIAAIHDQVRQLLRLDATILRCVEVRDPFAPASGLDVFVLESGQMTWARPPGTDWFGPDELAGLELVDERQHQAIEQYFSEEIADGSPPWMRRGWLASTISWLEAEFDRVGLCAADRVHQVRASSASAVLRVPLRAGSAWLKLCGEAGAHEPEITALLARECPRLLPDVLAVDPKRRLLLTRDAGAAARIDVAAAEWLLRGLAELQIHTCDQPQRLLELGCPDARPEILRARVDGFLERLAARAQQGGAPGSLEEPARLSLEPARLAPAFDALAEAFAELALGEVPAALHHPEFGPESVVGRGAELRVIDWSGALAHPFLSPAPLLEAFGEPERERLLEVYLAHWLCFAPDARLRSLYHHARRVAPLYRAMEALDALERARTLGERELEQARLELELTQVLG